MGLFDRQRKRADSTADKEGKVVVPEGHRVDTYRANLLPGVQRSSAGVWLAHFGIGSDEQTEEVDHVLAEVEGHVGNPQPRILLASAQGTLSSLMAPADPKLTPLVGLLLWTINAAALAGAPHTPALVQRFLRRLYVTARSIPQNVFVMNCDTASAQAVVTLIHELGIGVRTPDPNDMLVLAEVHRPEGVIISALAGAPCGEASAKSAWAREVNEQKDRAAGDRERLARLEKEELRALAERLAPNGAVSIVPVERAPRLRRLLLAVAENDCAATRTALYEELGRREIPLLFMVDPQTRSAALRSWPGGFTALAVYIDNLSLLTTARALGLSMDSFGVAEVKPTTLFGWAASQGWAVAICVFAEADRPIYVRIPADDMRAPGEVH
jgi:hypothetical protein